MKVMSFSFWGKGASGNWAVALFCSSGYHQEGSAYTPGISYLPGRCIKAKKSISSLISSCMATRDNYTRSLRFSIETDTKLGKLALKYGYSKFQFFNQMVEYFHRTKKDPADVNDELLKRTLSRNHDAYTSFIKTQEKILLIPMHQSVERMIRNQEQIVRYFNEQVLGANKELLKLQQNHAAKIGETGSVLKLVYESLQTRKKLKTQFLSIFDGYVKNREYLGSFKTKEKEELIDQIRKQIGDL